LFCFSLVINFGCVVAFIFSFFFVSKHLFFAQKKKRDDDARRKRELMMQQQALADEEALRLKDEEHAATIEKLKRLGT
jgi:large-conductance mechanosensitive channel